MIDLEQWVINVLNGIKSARDLNVSEYTLILNKEEIKTITEAYDNAKWIEIDRGNK